MGNLGTITPAGLVLHWYSIVSTAHLHACKCIILVPPSMTSQAKLKQAGSSDIATREALIGSKLDSLLLSPNTDVCSGSVMSATQRFTTFTKFTRRPVGRFYTQKAKQCREKLKTYFSVDSAHGLKVTEPMSQQNRGQLCKGEASQKR